MHRPGDGPTRQVQEGRLTAGLTNPYRGYERTSGMAQAFKPESSRTPPGARHRPRPRPHPRPRARRRAPHHRDRASHRRGPLNPTRSIPTSPTGATNSESPAAGQAPKTETYVPRHVRHMSRDITSGARGTRTLDLLGAIQICLSRRVLPCPLNACIFRCLPGHERTPGDARRQTDAPQMHPRIGRRRGRNGRGHLDEGHVSRTSRNWRGVSTGGCGSVRSRRSRSPETM